MKKRTDADFSKHELEIIKNDEVTIHYLKLPDTVTHSIKFINCHGILAVTGDYGHWIFCREFIPSPGEKVSDGYWCEKASIATAQEVYEFDEEGTRKQIQERIDEIEKPVDEESEEMIYLNECMSRVDDDEYWYNHYAHTNMPDGYDIDYVPYCKKIKGWLLVIFDGFDEICRRMEE